MIQTHLKALVVLLAAVGWASTSCSREPSDSARVPEAEAPTARPAAAEISAGLPIAMDPEVIEGKALYEENCMECHGQGALGDGPLASGLPVKPANILEHLGEHADAEMVQQIKGGIPPAMPPTSITRNEIRRVLAYAWSLIPDSARAARRVRQSLNAEEH